MRANAPQWRRSSITDTAVGRARQALSPWRLACCSFLLGFIGSTAGCGGLRTQAANFGSDVVGAVREQEPELFEMQRRLADSAGVFLGRAVEDQVLVRARGLWDTLLLKANDQTGVLIGRVARGVEHDLNRSLQVALDENLAIADARTRRLIGSALESATAGSGPLIDAVMASAELGIRERLRPVLIEVVAEAADSLSTRIRTLDRILAESETGKRISGLAYGIIAALGGVVVLGGLVWRRSEHRHRMALREAGDALRTFGVPQQDAVVDRLRRRGFNRQADIVESSLDPPSPPDA